MKVIAVVGLPASGKGEVSAIALEMGIPVVVMGDVIRKALMERGLPPTDENLGEMGRILREEHGRDAIAKATIPNIEALDAPVVMVDGIRSDAEVAGYRKHFDGFVLIGIQSSFDARFQRLFNRKRSDDPADKEHLRVRDERELGWGLGSALEDADITLFNEGTLESFQDEIRALLKRLWEDACR